MSRLKLLGIGVAVWAGVAAGQTPPAQAPSTPPPPAPASQLSAAGEEPREAVVLLQDGREYSGLLVQRDGQKIVLRIGAIDMPFDASRVARVIVLPPVLDRYREMRSSIDDTDTEGLLRLVEWLRVRGQWSTALKELDHILTIDPLHYNAKQMRTLVAAQQKLAEQSGQPRVNVPGAAAPAAEDGFPLLSERDINVIKVYEVDLKDPPGIRISRETIRRLLEQHDGDPALPRTQDGKDAMYRQNPVKILETMFKVQARNLYSEVQVKDHPRSMQRYRDDVQRAWLMNSCATTRCHGGAEAGRLRLASARPNSDATVYTNFLILDRFTLADGTPLINYDKPAESPLLHLALPRDQSLFKHPEVKGLEGRADQWRPPLRSVDDGRFEAGVRWIRSMYRPRPTYPIEYTPPGSVVEPPGPPVER